MKRFTAVVILFITFSIPSITSAGVSSQKAIHDMHMMMRFMDHALCVALEGADMQMLGQMGMSEGHWLRHSIHPY
jgi:hypothetical protein